MMSMIGFAASPGTDVLPTCSTALTRRPQRATISARASSYIEGQRGSYSTTRKGRLVMSLFAALPDALDDARRRSALDEGERDDVPARPLDLLAPVYLIERVVAALHQ